MKHPERREGERERRETEPAAEPGQEREAGGAEADAKGSKVREKFPLLREETFAQKNFYEKLNRRKENSRAAAGKGGKNAA